MVFSSPIFIFIFLPIIIFLIWIAPKWIHNTILLIASLVFYSWGSLSQTPIFLFSILSNFCFGLLIANSIGKKAKLFVSLAIITNLSLLVYFKYFNFFFENFNSLISITGHPPFVHEKIALPIGISFFTFHALSYVIDVYRKRVTAQRNILDLALYISFFPQLIAGPIVRYIDVATQFKQRVLSLEKATAGLQRFVFGFAKKVIVANTMAYIADQVFLLPISEISNSLAWLGIIAYTLQIYFDFSGYSDMAIGLAKIFGFDFLENFNYPYSAKSIKEFWRRWHISLSNWFRDFLYIPLGGNRGSETRTIINLLIVFLCTGFWHGASWTFLIWGLYHGVFLLLERMGLEKVLSRTPKIIRAAYTILVVMIGWVFFRAETLTGAINYLGKMFFISSNTQEQNFGAEYLNTKTIFLLIFGIIYSFRLLRLTQEQLELFFKSRNKENIYLFLFNNIKFTVSVVLLFVSVSYLSASTYNPFIYFRF